jgi:Nucleotidyl transferase AbiEii toxin, Type IV TA system
MNDAESIFHAAIDALRRTGSDVLLIGGLAVNHYGFSRATSDIDFMLASTNAVSARREMVASGFVDVEDRDNVTYFRMPESSFRVDFLKVDQATMSKLVGRAVTVRLHDRDVNVPDLKDLLAMKLFALKHGGSRRMYKDLPDIAYLVKHHGVDVDLVLKPLALEFADEELFAKIIEYIKGDR